MPIFVELGILVVAVRATDADISPRTLAAIMPRPSLATGVGFAGVRARRLAALLSKIDPI